MKKVQLIFLYYFLKIEFNEMFFDLPYFECNYFNNNWYSTYCEVLNFKIRQNRSKLLYFDLYDLILIYTHSEKNTTNEKIAKSNLPDDYLSINPYYNKNKTAFLHWIPINPKNFSAKSYNNVFFSDFTIKRKILKWISICQNIPFYFWENNIFADILR